VNKEMYTDILRRLRDAARRKPPEKRRTNSWFLLHENAPAHRSVLVKDFLANNNVTTLEHTQHSPDLIPADLYQFPRFKSTMMGRRFCDVTDIIKNEAEELKRFSQTGFQERMQHFTVAGRSVQLQNETIYKKM
jgi:hypothetical protein